LLIFFSPNDCPACLKEISLWNRLLEALPVKVIGLVPHYNAGEISYFILNEDIRFEVWIDLEQKLYEYIDFSETPIKVLIDKRNDILSITKSFLNQKHEEAYFNYIEELTE
jgi:peroxiredoxin